MYYWNLDVLTSLLKKYPLSQMHYCAQMARFHRASDPLRTLPNAPPTPPISRVSLFYMEGAWLDSVADAGGIDSIAAIEDELNGFMLNLA